MELKLQLKIARVEKELNQKQVSESTGVSQSTISGVESGKIDPQLTTVVKLADFYGFDLRIISREQ